MSFVPVDGLPGKLYVPEELKSEREKKHSCPDCRFCRWCSDAKCAACKSSERDNADQQ